jgi:glycosyltransferase involved in cell wall biosynthesis
LHTPKKSLAILHVLLAMGETSAPYNEHCLPMLGKRKIAICTYFKPTVRPASEIALFAGDGTLIGFFRALRAALAAREYDIIHAHSPHAVLLLLIARLFRREDLISSTVCTMHSSYPNYKFRNKLMLVPAFAFPRRVVCCSHASFESFPGLFKRLAGDRLCVVQNGLDINRVDYVIGNKPEYYHNGSFTVVSVGRLIKVKNPFATLSAFHQIADRTGRLVFIGEGYLRNALMVESKACSLGRQVELAGLIQREKVYEHLTKADLFISTSQVEGLPVAVIEAMACRCPVLLSDIPPHREIAAGADFIPLVQPNDVAGFAREIERFRQMSATERARIGERCRKIAVERFSLAAMHKGYEAVYDQVLGR